MMKKLKAYVNYFRLRGETADNAESRRKETGEQSNWVPTDAGRGTRFDTGPGKSEGKRFPQYRRPDNGK